MEEMGGISRESVSFVSHRLSTRFQISAVAGVLRTDLLARLNDLLQINYTKIEQYGSDGAYFQILDFIYDTKPFHANLWTLNSLSRRCPDVLREDECTT